MLDTSTHNLNAWLSHIRTYRVPVFEQLSAHVGFRGTGMELGAGTSWLSALLSRSHAVEKITAVEIDAERQTLAQSFFVPALGGVAGKIDFHLGSFHDDLPIKSHSLDFIVVDAALHHTNNLPQLLTACHKLLKPSGVLAAIREPVLPSFYPLRLWKKLMFGRDEKKHGDIEKIYSKKEWIRYFSEAGFTLSFHGYFLNRPLKEKIVRALRVFNGVLFNRSFFIARLILPMDRHNHQPRSI